MKRTLLLASAILLLSGAMAHGKDYESQRPAPEKRLFRSEAVESKITQMQGILTNPRLAWMFANCYPNTLDTTVHFGKDEDGNFRTFVYTGDIHAMWLRDSGAQVWPYIQLANEDEHLRNMLAGVLTLAMIHPTCLHLCTKLLSKARKGDAIHPEKSALFTIYWLSERKKNGIFRLSKSGNYLSCGVRSRHDQRHREGGPTIFIH